MSKDFVYRTIEQPAMAEFKDRGSKFLAYGFPIQNADDFKKHLQQLKKEHPKAAHHCFAYRIGIDANTFRVSDDGEPSGSAGKPILGQIDSKEFTNTLVVVVRYFGGTLLGVPGLINAYKTATALALQLTPIVQKQVMRQYAVAFRLYPAKRGDVDSKTIWLRSIQPAKSIVLRNKNRHSQIEVR